MLQAQYSNTKLKDEEVKVYANDISITPLSIPMLCGPGAIANGIMLMEKRQHHADEDNARGKHRIYLHIDLHHPAGFHEAGAHSRRNRQQRDDATHGTHTYGDSGRMLLQRTQANRRFNDRGG